MGSAQVTYYSGEPEGGHEATFMSLIKRLATGLRASDGARAIPYAMLLVAGIALIDWRVVPNVSLGFLYVFPILVAAPWLNP